MLKTKLFIVSGHVQGVGFRYATQNKAVEMGLTGWVRNKANGEVEGIVQGTEDRVIQFESWLWQGPKFAGVTRVICQDVRRESIDEFRITH